MVEAKAALLEGLFQRHRSWAGWIAETKLGKYEDALWGTQWPVIVPAAPLVKEPLLPAPVSEVTWPNYVTPSPHWTNSAYTPQG